jgi:hypothetical protein
VEFKSDGFGERAPDDRLNPGPMLAEEFLNGYCGRRKQ